MGAAPGQPPSALEGELLAMWSQRLGGRPLAVTDQLLSAGGDSLTAIRLIASAQRRYGVRLDRRRLFESFTVRAMAQLITEATRGTGR